MGRGQLGRHRRRRDPRRGRLADGLLLLDLGRARPGRPRRDERGLLLGLVGGRRARPAPGLRGRERVAESRRVLLDVRRDVAAGVVDLLRPVAAVDLAVVLVVAENLLEVVGHRARREDERRERNQRREDVPRPHAAEGSYCARVSDPHEPVAPARPAGAAMLGVALACIVAWALFSQGATALEEEAGLQIALCALALVMLAGLLFSPRVRLRAPASALAGVALLVLFAAWSGWSIAWSIAPDLSWVQLNRWAAYALVAALALVLGSSVRRAPQHTALAFLMVASAVAAYALGGKLVPWLSIPGLIDLDHTADFSRLRAPLGYWNALGLVCVLAGPIAVRTAADPEASARWRTFSLVALVALLVTLGLTYSRGGILSLLA